MRRMLALLLAVTLAGAVSAHPGHSSHGGGNASVTDVSAVLENPGEFVSSYNSNAEKLPSLVKSLISGERINVNVETGDGEKVIGVKMDGARIDSVKAGGLENPSVDFYTDMETLESIAAAEDPKKKAVSAFNGKGITYTAHGLGSQIKFAVVSTLSKALGFLL